MNLRNICDDNLEKRHHECNWVMKCLYWMKNGGKSAIHARQDISYFRKKKQSS